MGTVMVLDDDHNVRLMIERMLAHQGYSVSFASTIAEFDQKKDAEPIDLYIVDLALPDGDGMEAIRSIRRDSSSGIIILSAQDNENIRVAGLEVGADDYVSKPFRPRELAARIKAVVRRAQQNRASGERGKVFAGYRLLPESRQVITPGGAEVVLTTAEFNLFHALANRAGEVLSRDEIIAMSRGRDWRCDARSVDGLISRLRRKMPVEPGATHFIKTVHGQGYTIVA